MDGSEHPSPFTRDLYCVLYTSVDLSILTEARNLSDIAAMMGWCIAEQIEDATQCTKSVLTAALCSAFALSKSAGTAASKKVPERRSGSICPLHR